MAFLMSEAVSADTTVIFAAPKEIFACFHFASHCTVAPRVSVNSEAGMKVSPFSVNGDVFSTKG
ncbi:hypothetical protein D3C76_939910 [compost metagenome]